MIDLICFLSFNCWPLLTYVVHVKLCVLDEQDKAFGLLDAVLSNNGGVGLVVNVFDAGMKKARIS